MTATASGSGHAARKPRKAVPRRPAGADERNRQARGDLRRQQILDAAVELFAAKGYRGTGVAALAERVGMTATGVLYYFGSKERLLHEVVAERDRAAAYSSDVSLTLAGLRDLGRHNVETATLTRLYAVLGAEALDARDPLHDFFIERYETGRALVRDILQAELAEHRIRADVHIEQIATEVISMMIGLEIQWLADPARVDMAAAMEAYIDRLAQELAP